MAEVIINYLLDIQRGQKLLIAADSLAEPLIKEVYGTARAL